MKFTRATTVLAENVSVDVTVGEMYFYFVSLVRELLLMVR